MYLVKGTSSVVFGNLFHTFTVHSVRVPTFCADLVHQMYGKCTESVRYKVRHVRAAQVLVLSETNVQILVV